VGEHRAHERGLLDSGDHPQPAAIAGTDEDIEIDAKSRDGPTFIRMLFCPTSTPYRAYPRSVSFIRHLIDSDCTRTE
jgi:hypothetical protein